MTDDEIEARIPAEIERLLVGVFFKDSDGSVRHDYLTGDEEILPRKTLARLLRSHLEINSAIRWRLASLFDPDSSDDRKLKFELRNCGERGAGQEIRLAVARFIGERRGAGDSMKKAVSLAMKRYGVSERAAYRYYEEHRDSDLVRLLETPKS
jgi:hypothetical protein